MNVCKDLKIENKMDLKELENKVENLSGQLTVKDERITALENKVSDKEAEIETVQNASTKKDERIAELEGLVNASKAKEITNAVTGAISSGKFTEENKESLTKQATAMGVENFNEMIEMVKLPQKNAVAEIKNSTGDKKEPKGDEKLAKEYQDLATNNPAELKNIKNTEPAKFDKMFNAWNEA
jgi:phage I-like protein